MKKMFYLFNLLFFKSLFAGEATSVQGCNSSTQACIGKATGILATNDKFNNSVATINWFFVTFSMGVTIIFLIGSAKKLSDQDYVGSIGPALGAVIGGLSTFIAFSFFK